MPTTTPLTDAIEALTRYANETTGAGDTTLSEAVATLIEGYGQGGGEPDHWVRPSEWPNYDLLHLDQTHEESIYFTYDNRNRGGWMGIIIYTSPSRKFEVQKVKIESNGSVTVLETHVSTSTADIYAEDIVSDDDWVSYRVIPTDGAHITTVNLEGISGRGGFSDQPLVERYGYLPYITKLNIGYSYRDWMNKNVVSDTILGCQTALNVNISNCWQIKNVQITNGNITNMTNTPFLTYLSCKIASSKSNFGSACRNTGLIEVDWSSVNIGQCTSLNYSVYDSRNLKKFKFPRGDYSTVTNTQSTFAGCRSLEVIDLPDTLTYTLHGTFTGNVNACRAIVIRANQVVPLAGTGSINGDILKKGGARVYVPQALIEDYKVAEYWSTLYASYPNMFGAIEGSEFEETE